MVHFAPQIPRRSSSSSSSSFCSTSFLYPSFLHTAELLHHPTFCWHHLRFYLAVTDRITHSKNGFQQQLVDQPPGRPTLSKPPVNRKREFYRLHTPLKIQWKLYGYAFPSLQRGTSEPSTPLHHRSKQDANPHTHWATAKPSGGTGGYLFHSM